MNTAKFGPSAQNLAQAHFDNRITGIGQVTSGGAITGASLPSTLKVQRVNSASPTSPTAFIDHNLPRVEQALLDAVRTDDALLTEMASHLIVAGGKRQRPLFALASGACAPGVDASDLPEAFVLGGVAVELVHIGSLYHDDVIDEAEIRRTTDSVNARWGNLRAILAGDFLLARASEIAAGLSTEVAGLLASTIAKLCEGEVGELTTMFNPDRTVDAYLASIGGKTASLFRAAARIGGLVSGQSPDNVDALGEFGWCYGMAFQIVDDILDLTATQEQLGKPAGHDLVEGVYTLPAIFALTTPRGDELRGLLGGPIEGDDLARARDLIVTSGGIQQATDAVYEWLDLGRDALGAFPTNIGRTTLDALADRLGASIA